MGFISNFKKTFKPKYYINYAVLVLFLIVSSIMGANGAISRSMLGLLPRIAYSIIAAVSLNLVVGFLGELSLGHAGFMCVGAYIGCYIGKLISAYIDSQLAVFLIALVIGGCVAALFGFVVGLPALRLKGDYLAIVTLAFGEIVRNVFKNLEMFGGAQGLSTTTYSKKTYYIVAFIIVLVVLILTQNLIRSKHGRAITAIRDNEIAAKAMGINVTFYKLFVFIVSAFFAGMAGVMMGYLNTPILYSAYSYNFSIEILVMVVLGGIGSINGSIVAATLITYINFILQDKLSGRYAAIRFLVYALILIVVVLINNAPALRGVVDRLDIRKLFNKLFKKKHDPAVIKDDETDWTRIESKIKMDEILTVDIRDKESQSDGEDTDNG
jgi:branched-chain amino acid transport system permease protein